MTYSNGEGIEALDHIQILLSTNFLIYAHLYMFSHYRLATLCPTFRILFLNGFYYTTKYKEIKYNQ